MWFPRCRSDDRTHRAMHQLCRGCCSSYNHFFSCPFAVTNMLFPSCSFDLSPSLLMSRLSAESANRRQGSFQLADEAGPLLQCSPFFMARRIFPPRTPAQDCDARRPASTGSSNPAESVERRVKLACGFFASGRTIDGRDRILKLVQPIGR